MIFQEEWSDSSEEEWEEHHDSRRALHRNTYDNYFNLHYASKKHLER